MSWRIREQLPFSQKCLASRRKTRRDGNRKGSQGNGVLDPGPGLKPAFQERHTKAIACPGRCQVLSSTTFRGDPGVLELSGLIAVGLFAVGLFDVALVAVWLVAVAAPGVVNDAVAVWPSGTLDSLHGNYCSYFEEHPGADGNRRVSRPGWHPCTVNNCPVSGP